MVETQMIKAKPVYEEKIQLPQGYGRLVRIIACGWFLVNYWSVPFFSNVLQPANWNQLSYLEIICEALSKLNTIKQQLHDF